MIGRSICQAALERVLVSDGAWGTSLQNHGLPVGECPELWCLTQPEKVREIASEYIAAGSDMIQANSFGGNRYKLEMFGLEDKVREINQAAASLSRQAAGENHWVIPSVGPTGKMLIMGDVREEDMYNVFKEQVIALAAGGADALCIETMSALDEALLAIKAARENTDLEIISTFTFSQAGEGTEYRSMMGLEPKEAAQRASEAGAGIIGSNCGNGVAGMIEITRQMRAAVGPKVPILVHANAGLPQLVDGEEVFPETPEDTASRIPELIEAGVNIVGGCCGTTPAHVAAIKKVVEEKSGS